MSAATNLKRLQELTDDAEALATALYDRWWDVASDEYADRLWRAYVRATARHDRRMFAESAHSWGKVPA